MFSRLRVVWCLIPDAQLRVLLRGSTFERLVEIKGKRGRRGIGFRPKMKRSSIPEASVRRRW